METDNQSMSSITIKEIGEVKSKADGKMIKREVVVKIYSSKFGDDAEQELSSIKKRWEDGLVKPVKDYPPQEFNKDGNARTI